MAAPGRRGTRRGPAAARASPRSQGAACGNRGACSGVGSAAGRPVSTPRCSASHSVSVGAPWAVPTRGGGTIIDVCRKPPRAPPIIPARSHWDNCHPRQPPELPTHEAPDRSPRRRQSQDASASHNPGQQGCGTFCCSEAGRRGARGRGLRPRADDPLRTRVSAGCAAAWHPPGHDRRLCGPARRPGAAGRRGQCRRVHPPAPAQPPGDNPPMPPTPQAARRPGPTRTRPGTSVRTCRSASAWPALAAGRAGSSRRRSRLHRMARAPRSLGHAARPPAPRAPAPQGQDRLGLPARAGPHTRPGSQGQ
jgi:hypothetical protein